MKQKVILDTGPLVSLLNPQDHYHQWATVHMSEIEPPFLTCEAVITETCFLAAKHGTQMDAALELLENGFMTVDMALHKEIEAVRTMMRKYADIPMSLADACLARLVELHPGSIVMTLDSDFRVYRVYRDQPIKLVMPEFL